MATGGEIWFFWSDVMTCICENRIEMAARWGWKHLWKPFCKIIWASPVSTSFGMVDFLWYRQIRADNFDVIIRIFVGRKVRIVFIVEYSSACTSGCMHNFFPIPSVSCVMHVLDDFSFLGDFLGGDSDLFSGSGGTLVVSWADVATFIWHDSVDFGVSSMLSHGDNQIWFRILFQTLEKGLLVQHLLDNWVIRWKGFRLTSDCFWIGECEIVLGIDVLRFVDSHYNNGLILNWNVRRESMDSRLRWNIDCVLLFKHTSKLILFSPQQLLI